MPTAALQPAVGRRDKEESRVERTYRGPRRISFGQPELAEVSADVDDQVVLGGHVVQIAHVGGAGARRSTDPCVRKVVSNADELILRCPTQHLTGVLEAER